jgi:hypothetical protein
MRVLQGGSADRIACACRRTMERRYGRWKRDWASEQSTTLVVSRVHGNGASLHMAPPSHRRDGSPACSSLVARRSSLVARRSSLAGSDDPPQRPAAASGGDDVIGFPRCFPAPTRHVDSRSAWKPSRVCRHHGPSASLPPKPPGRRVGWMPRLAVCCATRSRRLVPRLIVSGEPMAVYGGRTAYRERKMLCISAAAARRLWSRHACRSECMFGVAAASFLLNPSCR